MLLAETRYYAGERDLLAVIVALDHRKYYLEGAVSLTIVTDHDHKPNVMLQSLYFSFRQ